MTKKLLQRKPLGNLNFKSDMLIEVFVKTDLNHIQDQEMLLEKINTNKIIIKPTE